MRIFFSVTLSPEIKRLINNKVIRSTAENFQDSTIRWTKESDLHITLLFIKNINPNSIEQLVEHAKVELNNFNTFKIKFLDIELFPSSENPKFLSYKISAADQLTKLFDSLNLASQKLGLAKDERPYRPHMTLGKILSSASIKIPIKNIELPEFSVSSIVLLESTPSPNGSNYKELYSINLHDKTHK